MNKHIFQSPYEKLSTSSQSENEIKRLLALDKLKHRQTQVVCQSNLYGIEDKPKILENPLSNDQKDRPNTYGSRKKANSDTFTLSTILSVISILNSIRQTGWNVDYQYIIPLLILMYRNEPFSLLAFFFSFTTTYVNQPFRYMVCIYNLKLIKTLAFTGVSLTLFSYIFSSAAVHAVVSATLITFLYFTTVHLLTFLSGVNFINYILFIILFNNICCIIAIYIDLNYFVQSNVVQNRGIISCTYIHVFKSPTSIWGAIWWFGFQCFAVHAVFCKILLHTISVLIISYTSSAYHRGSGWVNNILGRIGVITIKKDIEGFLFTPCTIQGKTWQSAPDYVGLVQIGKKKFQYELDACVTNSLQYIFGLSNFTEQDLYDFDSFEQFSTQIVYQSAMLFKHLTTLSFGPIQRKNGDQTKSGNPFHSKEPLGRILNEEIRFKTPEKTEHVYRRINILTGDENIFTQYMNQLDITVTTDPTQDAMILLYDKHCFIDFDKVDEYRRRLDPKRAPMDHINQKVIKIDTINQDSVSQPNLQKDVLDQQKKKRQSVFDLIDSLANPQISLDSEYFGTAEMSMLIGQEGYVQVNTRDNTAIISSGIQTRKLKIAYNLPFDYNIQGLTFLHRSNIAFHAQLVDISDTKDIYVPEQYKFRTNQHYGQVCLYLQPILKDFLLQVGTLTEDNINAQKQRFLEQYAGLSFTKNSLSVQNDLLFEYDNLLNSTIRYTVELLHLNKSSLSDVIDPKPEWYILLDEAFNLRQNYATKYVAKRNERLVSFLLRKMELEDQWFSSMFQILYNFMDYQDTQMVSKFINLVRRSKQYAREYIENDLQQLRQTDFRQNFSKISTYLISKFYKNNDSFMYYDYLNIFEAEEQSYGGRQTKKLTTQFYHKHDLACYDVLNTNPHVLKKMDFFHPITKHKITDRSPENIYNTYAPFCTCNKNAPKYSINPEIDNLGDNIVFSSYGACPLNAISGIIMRQAGSLNRFEPQVLERFKKFLERDDYVDKFSETLKKYTPQDLSFDSYIKHVSQVDANKAKQYRRGRTQAILGKLKTVFSCFPKSGEFFLKHIRKSITNLSNRPRNICSPDLTLLGLANHVNYIALKCLKDVCPQYTSHLNNEQLSQRIDQEWARIAKHGKPTCISADFKSHDTNQHAELIEAVDNKLWHQFLPQCWKYLNLPLSMQEDLKKVIMDTTSTLQCKIKVSKNYRKMFMVILNGTVTSGHPTRTTFGNTLRVIKYYMFIFDELGIVHYSMFVGGDDFFCILTEQDMKKLQDNIHKYFSKDDYGILGLGQCTKKLNILGNKVDFLSKIGIIKPSGVSIWRNFTRVAHKQLFSDSRLKDINILQVSSFFSYLHSNLSLPFVRKICSTYHSLPSVSSIIETFNNIKTFGNNDVVKLKKQILNQNPIISTRNDYTYSSYLETVQKIGDSEKVDPHLLQGMIRETGDNHYHWLSLYMKSNDNVHRCQTPNVTIQSNNKGLKETYGRRKVMNISIMQIRIFICVFLLGLILSDTQNLQYIHFIAKNEQHQQTCELEGEKFSAAHAQCTFESSQLELRKCQITKNILEMYDAWGQTCVEVLGSLRQILNEIISTIKEKNHTYGSRQTYGSSKKKMNVKAKSYVLPVDKKQNAQIMTIKQDVQQLKKKKQKVQKLVYNVPKQQGRAKQYNKYVASIMKPFSTAPMKAPYDYPLNTCVFDQTMEVTCSSYLGNGSGVIPNGSYGCAVAIFPHAIVESSTINNGQSYGPGQPNGNIRFITQFYQGTGAYTDVKDNTAHPMSIYQGKNNDSTARWTSCRILRLGVRIIPTTNITSRSGLIQIVQIPGKDQSIYLNGSAISGNISIPIPSTTQIKTYPTSYEASNASNQVMHEYVWVPTDLIDSQFQTDSVYTYALSTGVQGITGELDVLANHLRNAIYILATGLASTDSFRLEIKTSVEYVPSTSFRQWGDSTGMRATNADQEQLKNIIVNDPQAQADQSSYIGNAWNAVKNVAYAGTEILVNNVVDRFSAGVYQNNAQNLQMQRYRNNF